MNRKISLCSLVIKSTKGESCHTCLTHWYYLGLIYQQQGVGGVMISPPVTTWNLCPEDPCINGSVLWVCFDKGWFPFWDCVRLFVIRSRSDVAFPRHLSLGMNSFDTVKPYIPPDKELSPSPIDVKSPPTHDLEFYVDDHTAIFLVSGHCPAVRVWQNDDDTTR